MNKTDKKLYYNVCNKIEKLCSDCEHNDKYSKYITDQCKLIDVLIDRIKNVKAKTAIFDIWVKNLSFLYVISENESKVEEL
jgi:hypothetical protein